MLGGQIYQVLSLHEDRSDINRSLQRFIDQYGRGPFLSPPHLIYVHVKNTKLLPETRTTPT
jgi:hypothetical protein